MASSTRKDGDDQNALTTKKTMETKRKIPYEYTKLVDVKANTKVNVYGVIKYTKKPFLTSTNQYCSTISLVDPSLANMEDSLKCVLFAKQSAEELPNVQNIGDIVRFHRLSIGTYKGGLQGTKGQGFSWLVFDGRQSSAIRPKSSHDNYSYTENDTEIIQELKTWTSQQPELNVSTYQRSLSDLKVNNQFVNITGQAVAIYTFPENNRCALIRMWDGTEPSVLSFHGTDLDDANVSVSLKLLKVTKGKTLDVYIYDDHVTDVAKIKPGDVIAARNVHIKKVQDQNLQNAFENGYEDFVEDDRLWAEMMIHGGTAFGRGISVLAPTDPDFLDVKGKMRPIMEAWDPKKGSETRDIVKKDTAPVRALEESCTETLHPLIPFTLINDVKACQTIPNKFRCRTKVFYYFPQAVEKFVKFSCNKCKTNVALTDEVIRKLKNLEPLGESHQQDKSAFWYCETCHQEMTLVYVLLLILEDESGMLEVLGFGKDAERFLDHCSPLLLIQDNKCKENVQDKMDSVLGGENCQIDFEANLIPRPYFECCIKSYRVFDTTTEKELIKYQLFDTTLC